MGGSQPKHSGSLDPPGSTGYSPTWTHSAVVPEQAAPSGLSSQTGQPGGCRPAGAKAQKGRPGSSVEAAGGAGWGLTCLSPKSWPKRNRWLLLEPVSSGKPSCPAADGGGCVSRPQLCWRPLAETPGILKACELTAMEGQSSRSRWSPGRRGSIPAARQHILADRQTALSRGANRFSSQKTNSCCGDSDLTRVLRSRRRLGEEDTCQAGQDRGGGRPAGPLSGHLSL